MLPELAVVLIFLSAIFFSGCISGSDIPASGTGFEVKPSEVAVKSGENAQVMIRVTNNGKSVIHPFVRFNLNSSDKKYVKFSNVNGSYDIGVLRPGEDSGFKIVDFKADLAAGREMKYQTRAQVIYNGAVLESRDIIITVSG
ncbi:Uncharacterised protein [uncultured archaeon]|nr:Uncharacterised protein [uncultured archaeon]